MNKLFETRNKQICAMFHAQYGRMPTMVLYAHIGAEFGLSEESIRKIVKAGLRGAIASVYLKRTTRIGKVLPTKRGETD